MCRKNKNYLALKVESGLIVFVAKKLTIDKEKLNDILCNFFYCNYGKNHYRNSNNNNISSSFYNRPKNRHISSSTFENLRTK